MDEIKCELIMLYEVIRVYTDLKKKNNNVDRALHYREGIDKRLRLNTDEELIQLIEYSEVDDNRILDKQFLNFVAKSGDTNTMFNFIKRLSNHLQQIKPYLNSALIKAAKYVSNLEVVKILINYGNAKIDCKDMSGNSPLHWAVFGACDDIIRYLIYKGANINATNLLNETPLHWCADRYDERQKFNGVDSEISFWYKQLKEVNIRKKVYLAIALNFINDSYADTSIKNSSDKTAVSIIEDSLKSNMNYSDEQKQFILSKLFPLNDLEKCDDNCLLNACKAANLLQIEYLLDNNAENQDMLNKTDDTYKTALHCLIISFNCHQNHSALKKLKFKQVSQRYIDLVSKEVLTDVRETEYGENVFLCAAKYGNETIVDSIINKCGKQVFEQKNRAGYYAIHLAASNNQTETIRMLCDNGDDLNKCLSTVNADTPLMLAVLKLNCDAIELLVKLGADVNKTDFFGFPPIFYAINHWNREIPYEKLPKASTSTRIEFWYRKLIEIGFRNCVNFAIACYLINDCKSRVDIVKPKTIVIFDPEMYVFNNVIDLLKHKIETERIDFKLNETQIDFLHRYIVSINNNSELVYRNLSEPRGLCIIINNYEVSGETSRKGSEIDAENLVKVFREHKYDVESHLNLEAEQMRTLLEKYSESIKLKDYDSFIVIVMSHVGQHTIMGSDGISLKIRELIELFGNDKCPQLFNKPKIFIFQACGGDNEMLQYGIDTNLFDGPGNEYAVKVKKVSIPHITDIIICYATVFGYKAVRTDLGAWYCQAMAQVLVENQPNTDLLTQLQIIDKKIESKTQETTNEDLNLVTSYKNIGFKKKFFFNV